MDGSKDLLRSRGCEKDTMNTSCMYQSAYIAYNRLAKLGHLLSQQKQLHCLAKEIKYLVQKYNFFWIRGILKVRTPTFLSALFNSILGNT